MSEHGAPYAPYLPDRIRERLVVVLPSGCWLWQGYVDPKGYGRVRVGKGKRATHLVVWAAFGRTIPPGYELDHAVCHDPAVCRLGNDCPHRRCANPWHLRAVPIAENRRRSSSSWDARADGRCRQGHDLTLPDAIYTAPNGVRRCRACMRARQAESYARMRARVAS